MTNQLELFSIRAFLRKRQALLVHFSTVMARRDDLLFPEDLRNATRLVDAPLSFSTILATDVGPHKEGRDPALANAGGSVGIVVDIRDNGSVLTVGHSDDGTYFDSDLGTWVSGGIFPTAESCARSIDDRRTANEWFVKNYKVIGLFVYCPILVRKAVQIGPDVAYVESPIALDVVFSSFPEYRIFSANDGKFVEFDRAHRKWIPIEYESILAS